MKFPRILFVVAVAGLALAACGGGAGTPTAPPVAATEGASGPGATPGSAPTTASTAQPSTAPAATQAASVVDLCSLLTADDLHTVLGGSWLEGQLTSTGGYCHWDAGNQPNEQTITATDPRTIAAIKAVATSSVDMTVAGHAGLSIRQPDAHLQTTYVDLGGQLLIIEFGTSSSAADDQAHAQQLAEIAVGNL